MTTEPTLELPARLRAITSGVFWWTVTIAVLVALDDLVFGPLFWTITRILGQWQGVLIAFTCSVALQLFLVWRGTATKPGRISRYVLRGLHLQRKSRRVGKNEQSVRTRVAGTTSAILLAPVIGGELPPMLLWRQGWPAERVRRLAILTSVIYACEFAFLHAWLPGQW